MEVKKSRQADLDRQRPVGFLLGLLFVGSLLFVAMEWNSDPQGWAFFDLEDDEPLEAEIDLQPLHRDKDEVPMALPNTPPEEIRSDELNVVEEVETDIPEEVALPEVAPLEQDERAEQDEENPKAVDMYDEPLDVRVVEDLPQFPGGAVAFMKWLTENLKYPQSAQQRKVQGKVLAQFTVNTDGSISDLQVIEHLDPQCDREVMRVLQMMPNWQAGVMDAKPCRTRVCIPIVFHN